MNILKISTLLYSALFVALLVGCESEDDVIPEITPQKKAEEVKVPQKAENDAEKKSDAMPELQPIQSLSSETAGAESTASTGASVEPGSEGSVTIQVSIQPSKRSANAILKKLEEKGIKGYLAQVENPGELEGTYYRVRIGYFKKLEDAKAFGKNRLEPMGFAWWIDNKSNDAVGSPETSDSENAYDSYSTTSYSEPASETASIPSDSEVPASEEISSSSEVATVESSASETVTEAPAQLETSAPAEAPSAEAPTTEAPAAPAAQEAPAQAQTAPETTPAATEEVYDDWE